MKRSRLSISVAVAAAACLCGIPMLSPPADAELTSSETLPVLMERGAALQKAGTFNEALDIFEQALHMSRDSKSQTAELECLMKIALLKWNIGEIDESYSLYQESYELAKQISNVSLQTYCKEAMDIVIRYNEGKRLREIGEYVESASSFQVAIRKAEGIHCQEFSVKCLRLLSATFWEAENIVDFENVTEEALSISIRLNHKKEQGRCHNNLGLLNMKSGNYIQAFRCYENAYEIAEAENDVYLKAGCLNNMGLIYKHCGDTDRAVSYLLKSYEIDKELEDYSAVAMDLSNIATVYIHKYIVGGSRRFLYMALEHLETCNEYVHVQTNKDKMIININKADVFNKLGQHIQALECLAEAENQAVIDNSVEGISTVHLNSGDSYLELGDYSKASQEYEKALQYAIDSGSELAVWRSYYGLGKLLISTRRYSEAKEFLLRALSIIEKTRSAISFDHFASTYIQDKYDIYEKLIEIFYYEYIKTKSETVKHELISMLERSKAQSFLDSLIEYRVQDNSVGSIDWQAKKRQLTTGISKSLANIVGFNELQRSREIDKLRMLEDEYMRHLSYSQYQNMAYSDELSDRKTSMLSLLENALELNSAILEYFMGTKFSLAIILFRNRLEVFELPAREMLEKEMQGYLKGLADHKICYETIYNASLRIGEVLLSPLKSAISAECNHLIVIPDGILNYMPFETLMIPVADAEAYLIDKMSVSYSPSAASLFFLINSREQRAAKLLAIGNPIYNRRKIVNGSPKDLDILSDVFTREGIEFQKAPKTREELIKISRRFKRSQRKILLNENASEESIKKMSMEEYGVVHFACHGILDEVNPFRSALVLSPGDDPNEDGFLQVREIYNMRIPAELVVLSACQTGRGRLERGEGMMGLPRIFFQAGARSVVSSLWRIHDASAAVFMDKFYEHLASGESKAKALQKAKIEMIRSRYSHPAHWGAFILNGEYRSSIDIQ